MSNTCQSWVYFSNPAGPGSIRGSWTLPVTWESNGTSSTLAFWPWSKKALKHVLNFKHMSAPTHIKGLLIHWKLSICRNTLRYQLLCWASYRITPYQVTFWKKETNNKTNYHLNRSWLEEGPLTAKGCPSTCGRPLWSPTSSRLPQQLHSSTEPLPGQRVFRAAVSACARGSKNSSVEAIRSDQKLACFTEREPVKGQGCHKALLCLHKLLPVKMNKALGWKQPPTPGWLIWIRP